MSTDRTLWTRMWEGGREVGREGGGETGRQGGRKEGGRGTGEDSRKTGITSECSTVSRHVTNLSKTAVVWGGHDETLSPGREQPLQSETLLLELWGVCRDVHYCGLVGVWLREV